MSRAVKQPITQVRLTNVAVVRYSRAGKRFEIACYRNKVVNWRNKVETDINEVLQIDNVFQNVSKGVLAKQSDLEKAFGTTDLEEVCKIILDKGELQVSDKERAVHYENVYRDVATIISEKCVNSVSNRPYTVSMIQNAMKSIGYSVNPNRGAKQQALEVIKLLQQIMPIQRAKMKLRVIVDNSVAADIHGRLQNLGATQLGESKVVGEEYSMDLLVDPQVYREVEEEVCGGGGERQQHVKGSVEVLQVSVQEKGEADFDVEMARREIMALQMKEGGAGAAKAHHDAAHDDDDHDDDDGGDSDGARPRAKMGATTSNLLSTTAASGGGGDGDYSDDDGDGDNEGGSKDKGKGKSGGGGGGGGGQQKLSKKAKRREKEKEAEKEARARENLRRQQERQAAKGAGGGNAGAAGGDGHGGETSNSDGVTASGAAVMTSDGGTNASGGAGGGSGVTSSKMKCNTCNVAFESTTAHREHFKSDWHRYNLKMKMQGIPTVGKEEFEQVDAEEFFFSENR